MSKTKKILAICLVVSAISTVIQIVSGVLNPESLSIPVTVSTGIVPIVILIALLSQKKDDEK